MSDSSLVLIGASFFGVGGSRVGLKQMLELAADSEHSGVSATGLFAGGAQRCLTLD